VGVAAIDRSVAHHEDGGGVQAADAAPAPSHPKARPRWNTQKQARGVPAAAQESPQSSTLDDSAALQPQTVPLTPGDGTASRFKVLSCPYLHLHALF
jgi:hypothetical protein